MERVVKISTHGRANHVAFLLADGTVAVCGHNGYGQLGMLDPWQPKVPTIIPDLTDVKSVACSCVSTIFILNDGTMKVSGSEINNYLGISKEETTLWVPTLSSITNVKEVCCGYSLMLYTYLLNDGSVIVSGNDAYGALGLNRVNSRVEPILNPYLNNVSQISLSDGFCNYLLKDKSSKYCGSKFANNTLQLTTVPSNGKIKQIESGQLFAAYLMEDGTVKVWGSMGYDEFGKPLSQIVSFDEVTAIEGLENVTQIACGGNYVLCLQGDGNVKAFGFNNYGTFGLGSKSKEYMPPILIPGLKNVVQVACTEYCSYFLLADGTVMGCGYNNTGQLGVGDTAERTSLTEITALTPPEPEEPEPEPEPDVPVVKEITVRVHQKTLDGYRRIRFEGGETTVVSKQYQQVTKLGVTAPKTEDIEIAATEDFCLPPVEVLKFVQNEQDKVVSVCTFDNSDAGDFLVDGKSAAETEAVVFDGTMKPNTSFAVAFTEPQTLGDGMLSESAEIDFAVYKKVEGIEVE